MMIYNRKTMGIGLALVAVCIVLASLHGAPDAESVDRSPTDTTSVRSFGAVGDGKTDDTVAIQAAIDSRAGVVRLPRGVYRTTKTLQIHLNDVGPTSIVADGPATIVMDGPGPAIRFIGTHEGTADPTTFQETVWRNQRAPMVDGLEIVGEHVDARGIEATGTMQLTMTRVVLRKLLHGIHLVSRNRNVIISNCHIYENRGIGIYYDNVNLHQSNIIGCHISYNDAGGVVIRGGDVRNVQIGTCDIEGNMGNPQSDSTANVLLDSSGGSIGEVTIVGCTIQHAHNAPESANIRINGQSTARPFTDETRHGNITISDNVLSDVQVNIDIMNTRGATITGNTIWKGYTANLRVHNSTSLVVSNNVFDRNPRYHYGDGSSARLGLTFTSCHGCTVNGNHIEKVGDTSAAMAIHDCNQFNITNNTILACNPCGLLLENVSHSRISDCLIRDADPSSKQPLSLRVTGGSGNMIVDNLLGNGHEVSGDSHLAGNFHQ